MDKKEEVKKNEKSDVHSSIHAPFAEGSLKKEVKKESIKPKNTDDFSPQDFMEDILLQKIVEDDKTLDTDFLDDISIQSKKDSIKHKLHMHQRNKKYKKFKLSNLQRYRLLRIFMYKAGIDKSPAFLIKIVVRIAIILTILATVYNVYSYWAAGSKWTGNILLNLILLVVFFFSFLIITFLVAMISLDYLAFKRRLTLESILPEYLRLVAANHRAGMPLDRSLWQANRPRFGVLAKEIELLAKTTYVKGDLTKSLIVLGKKYDSKLLERAMANISESLILGGNVSDLLEDIATNIVKLRNMKKDMAATIKNYIIFIIVSAVIICPFMFGVAFQMNDTISRIKADIDVDSSGGILTNIKGSGGLTGESFQTFVILMLVTNATISAMVISMIQYGNLGQGLKQIPLFFVVSLLIYLGSKASLAGVF